MNPLGNKDIIVDAEVNSNIDIHVGTSSVNPQIDPSISLLFLGDIMFDRGVRTQIKAHGYEYIFGPATSTISEHTLTIANLEGPITSNISKNISKEGKAIPGFQFTFPTNAAVAIKDSGIDIISLANNHTFNFGQSGLDETRRFLNTAGVKYFGSPSNSSSFIATTTCVTDQNRKNIYLGQKFESNNLSQNYDQICIGLVGWNEFSHANNDEIVNSIKKLRKVVDYLVVFPHWGIEYQATSTNNQRVLARKWIDAGADTVIGAHPHVVETIEEYKGKPIFYSLGNFIFDQYFSFETTHGIGVSIKLTKNNSKTSANMSGATNKTGSSISKESNITASNGVIPFSSVGTKVSNPEAEYVKKMFDQIKGVSSLNINQLIGGLN